MQGQHKTILTYFYFDAAGREQQLEVGEVACVPRKGEVVYLNNRQAYTVKLVTWTPDPTMLEDYNRPDMAARRPLMTTWVAVSLV